MNTSADLYFADGCGRCKFGGTPQCKVNTWRGALLHMREILNMLGLHETCKWGVPCYVYRDKNILLLTAFKDHAALNFFNGASLTDAHNLLQKAGVHSQGGRIYRFKRVEEINKHKPAIIKLIKEAMNQAEVGNIPLANPATINLPDELVNVFKENPSLEKAFYALTPGRQRAYLIYFTGAKQTATRLARIEKYIPQIIKGIGFHDGYKKAGRHK